MLDRSAFGQLLQQVAEEPSDVFVMAHGWFNDAALARSSYLKMLKLMTDMADARGLRPQGYRPLVVGVRWPSKAWVDDSAQPPVESESSGPGLAPDRPGPAGPSIDPRLVAAIYENFPRGRSSDREYARDVMRMQELLTIPSPTPGDLAEELALFRRYSLGAEFAEDGSGFASPRSGDLAVARPEGELSLLEPFRVFTYWQMKARAGVVGGNGVREMVATMQRQYRGAKFHLFGHSFGAKVVLSAVADRDRALPRAVETVVLLEPAISLESFADRVTDTSPPVPGGYRRALDPGRVKGPIVLTYSGNDKALVKYYPLASRLAGQTGETEAEGRPPVYAALGAVGAWGAEAAEFGPSRDVPMRQASAADNAYGFARGVWSVDGTVPRGFVKPKDANGEELEGTAYIQDHSLIYNDDVAWLLWQAILAGRQ
jgi:hypothetical protein